MNFQMATLLSHFKPTSLQQQTSEKVQKDNTTEKSGTVPWVEKYRPKKVDDLVYQEEVVAVLKKCVLGADLPNLLFYGPPGTGKTSAAVALCRQLFKTHQLYKDRVLEMNASDERGIDIVRNRIKDFAKVSISASSVGKESVVPLKIVILDEADAMTGAAQSALRRTMESETQSTRFFLICNYITRIIEPLTSRCAKFRFKPLSTQSQKERLTMICSVEKVKVEEQSLEELVNICGGDLRKSITLLQSLSSLGHAIGINDVRELSGQIPEAEVNYQLEKAKSLNPEMVRIAVRNVIKKGYNANQLLSQLADLVIQDLTLAAGQKAKLFEKMAEAERRLTDGSDEYLQLLDVMLTVQNCFVEADIH